MPAEEREVFICRHPWRSNGHEDDSAKQKESPNVRSAARAAEQRSGTSLCAKKVPLHLSAKTPEQYHLFKVIIAAEAIRLEISDSSP